MPESISTMASIGDTGALNTQLGPSLEDVWMDRDIGWLDFNERVLAEAMDHRTPLLERAKFLAIFTSNLDEFFMKRVSVLRHSPKAELSRLRERINDKLQPALGMQAAYFRETLIPELADNGVHLRLWRDLTPLQMEEAHQFFDAQVTMAITPLVINSAQNFPFLSHLSTSLVFWIDDPEGGHRMFGRVKVPSGLPQWVQLQSDVTAGNLVFVRLHEVIRANLHKLYVGMLLGGISLVRLTRDAEVDDADEQELSLLEQVRHAVKKRRFQPVVRLEFGEGSDPSVKALLTGHFQLHSLDVFEVSDELDYLSLFQIAGLNLPQLKDKPWIPTIPAALRNGHDLFSVIRAGDILVHHPYESFDATVEHFIEAAATDPDTVAIKMTVYRVGDDTPFVKSLIKAAETGKEVACVIELHARFDEERNLHWASALEKAGAHVDFGVKGLKIHAKTALVVRREQDGLRAYIHIGTGNYHVRTARLYADFGLLTVDTRLTYDVVSLFHYLTGHSDSPKFKSLLVAPATLRSSFLDLIQREIEFKRSGAPARIIAKMNQLEDPDMIEALVQASRAGVEIDLIVRGFCCLKPGIPGSTENIRVRSIIGRFLEHSRIYYFAGGAANPQDGSFFIGSADWMFRNLSRRIEVVTPVLAAGPKQRLWETLEICLRDRRQAWIMDSRGDYSRSSEVDSVGAHRELMDLAMNSKWYAREDSNL